MKTVILAGGLGTRLSEETSIKPKPMVEVGGMPILWHIMKIYSFYGFNDFIVALGYKGDVIKDYFLNYHARNSDIRVHVGNGRIEYMRGAGEDWTVHMVDTGKDSLTGGRLHRLQSLLQKENTFMLTYGDGLARIDIRKLVEFHKSHGKLATITSVRPPARFGALQFEGNLVVDFHEKPQTGEGWVNGGFFVFQPGIFDYLHGDKTILEREPLENLARDGQLMGLKHDGFWSAMDTVRDRDYLNEQWAQGTAQWKIW
jgi:glucose-1-phosphate cytidylyltransferase